jgi:WD40 repeat protein
MGNAMNDNKVAVINCPTHESPYNGICGNKDCNESGLICLKCSPNACTTRENHPLISTDEFYLKFFAKSTGQIDFNKLNEILNQLKKIDKVQLEQELTNYNKLVNQLIDEKLNLFNDKINIKLELLRERVNKKLEDLIKKYLESESRLDLNFEMPENLSLEETKKFFETNRQNVSELEKMVNLIKKYSDNEKIHLNQRDLEVIFYSKNIVDNQPKEVLLEKIKKILTDLQSGLEEMASFIKIRPLSTNIFVKGLKKFQMDPNGLSVKQTLTSSAQKSYTIDSVFAAFTTNEGSPYLAWGDSKNLLNIYDLAQNTTIHQLSGHTKHIFIVRHFFNKHEPLDYLLTSSYDKSIKIWNVQTFSLVNSIIDCHTSLYLYSALLLYEESSSKMYAVSSAPNEYMKVWDSQTGTFVRNVGTTTDYTYYIDSWLDESNKELYIINANSIDVKIYEFRTGLLYKTFKSENSTWHMSALVHYMNEKPYLFETDGHGYLRIWDIHTGLIYKKIQASGTNLRGLCLWNDQYILAASSDKGFKIFDLTTFDLKSTKNGHENVVCSIEKIIHPNYGEVVLTSAIDGTIRLWTFKSD